MMTIMEAIDNSFGGGGVVLAGLASPEADFEASGVRCKSGLVGQEVQFAVAAHKAACPTGERPVVGN